MQQGKAYGKAGPLIQILTKIRHLVALRRGFQPLAKLQPRLSLATCTTIALHISKGLAT